MPVPKMAASPSASVGDRWEAGRNLEVAWLGRGSFGGVASGGPRLRVPALDLVEVAGDRRCCPVGGGWCPGKPAASSSRPRKAPRPHRGMDEGKMEEIEWRYHGEGNKSLVVAHAQVSGGLSARFRALTLLPGGYASPRAPSAQVGSASPQHRLPPDRFPSSPSPDRLRVPRVSLPLG